jgi:hypothetical protein
MSSSSIGSAGRRGTGRGVGLAHPRAGEASIARGGRAIANQAESARLQNEMHSNIRAHVDNDSFDLSDNEEIFVPIQAQGQPNIQEIEHDRQIREAVRPLAVPNAQIAAPASPRRRRQQWAHNNPRLNIMSRTLLMAPYNFEVAANSSGRASEMETLRRIKRLPNNSLAWNNLNHSGRSVLLVKCVAELNADAAYLETSGGALLNAELLRQKMNSFMTLAACQDEDTIDPSIYNHCLQRWSFHFIFV